jgi:hypothetical protein
MTRPDKGKVTRGNNEGTLAPDRMQMPVNVSAGKHTHVEIASAKIRRPTKKTTHTYPTLEVQKIPLGFPHQIKWIKARQDSSRPSERPTVEYIALNVPPAYGREKVMNTL